MNQDDSPINHQHVPLSCVNHRLYVSQIHIDDDDRTDNIAILSQMCTHTR